MKVDGSNATQVARKKPQQSLAQWLDGQQGRFVQALPKGSVSPERFLQGAKLAVFDVNNPSIAKCTPISILRSLTQSASLGLEVGGLLGQAYLIPYNEKGVMTCHFQMGYKGLLALARRSRTIKSIVVNEVCENDIFNESPTAEHIVDHIINRKQERGEVYAYYCLVKLENGGEQSCVMSKKEIEKHRDRYSKVRSNNSVWTTNFDAMAKKTVIIQALKLCPISIEALEAVRKEELKDAGVDIPTQDTQEPLQESLEKSIDASVEYAEPTEPTISQESIQEAKPKQETQKNAIEQMAEQAGAQEAFDNANETEEIIF